VGGPKGGRCFYLEKETWHSDQVNAVTIHLSHFPSFLDARELLGRLFSDDELRLFAVSQLDVFVDITDETF
jgi:hypothetical protein